MELCSMLFMWQPGWEMSLGENGYINMNGWVLLLVTWNCHNIVNQLYSNIKKLRINKKHRFKHSLSCCWIWLIFMKTLELSLFGVMILICVVFPYSLTKVISLMTWICHVWCEAVILPSVVLGTKKITKLFPACRSLYPDGKEEK